MLKELAATRVLNRALQEDSFFWYPYQCCFCGNRNVHIMNQEVKGIEALKVVVPTVSRLIAGGPDAMSQPSFGLRLL